MDTASTPRPQSAMLASQPARKRGPPAHLRIDTPSANHSETLVFIDTPASSSTLSSTTSDTDSFIFPPPSRPHSRNMKKLSLTLPSATSSTNSLFSPLTSEPPASAIDPFAPRRRSSTISLPTSSLLHRRDEDYDGSPTIPYADGPVQVLPGIWLGNEDNARDWRGLMERGINTILNVAKELITPFDSVSAQPLRPFMSTPDLNSTLSRGSADPTYYPPHPANGRPGMQYLKLPWSHGQADLVTKGFPEAMAFVDQALGRGDSVLIHCQCGVSRSATLVIALVMRAAATRSPTVPSEVWALKGMQGAYSFVKEKSKWVGPNMSLIYQLLDYERTFKPGDSSPASVLSSVAADEEWARRRQMVDDADTEDNDKESTEIMREARALDKAMEDRRVARKASVSSMCSSSSGIGMGQAWRNKYGSGRNRTGSIASIVTNGSVLSENLVEEDEEEELLGTGGGFTETSCSSAEPTEDEASPSNAGAESDSPVSGSLLSGTPKARNHARPRLPPPSAPAYKASFNLPQPPATAIRTTFDITPRTTKIKTRKRPPPLISVLSPVPPSPVTPVHIVPPNPVRTRTEGRRPELPPAQLRNSHKPPSKKTHVRCASAAPTQTLFVFPPSPTHTHSTDTPSTMTVTSNTALPFPVTTPLVSTFKTEGRRRSFIGVSALATPTTASSRVDARGWVGVR